MTTKPIIPSPIKNLDWNHLEKMVCPAIFHNIKGKNLFRNMGQMTINCFNILLAMINRISKFANQRTWYNNNSIKGLAEKQIIQIKLPQDQNSKDHIFIEEAIYTKLQIFQVRTICDWLKNSGLDTQSSEDLDRQLHSQLDPIENRVNQVLTEKIGYRDALKPIKTQKDVFDIVNRETQNRKEDETILRIARGFPKPSYDFKDAFERHKTAAANGDSESMLYLGYCYENRLGYTEADSKEKAFNSYLQASQKAPNNAEAAYQLGSCHYAGFGTKTDYIAAIPLLEKAASNGHGPASTLLGLIYEGNTGVDADLDKARKYFAIGAEAGDPEALLKQGQLSDPAEADKWYKQVERSNHPLTLCDLAEILQERDRPATEDTQSDKYWAALLLIKAVQQKHIPAMKKLAEAYDEGIGIEVDEVKASGLYRDAAELGDSEAMNEIAFRLHHGLGGLTANPKEALKYYEKAISLGNIDSMYNLATLYQNGGSGVKPDDKLALKYFTKAAKKGVFDAIQEVIKIHEKAPVKDEGLISIWIREAAMDGDVDSMIKLAERYQVGNGIEKNPKKAFFWLHKAAKKENPEAIEKLKKHYHSTPLDKKGVELFQKLAAKNDYTAAEALMNYFDSIKDFENEFKYAKLFAESNTPEALTSLGVCYATGIGTVKNPDEAIRLWEKAAEKGNVDALYSLGDFYSEISHRNIEKAIHYFTLAADKEDLDSMYELGKLYYMNSPHENHKTSFEWFNKAAKKGKVLAMREVAICYAKGIGVEKNPTLADEWFKKAIEQGDQEAANIYARYKKSLERRPVETNTGLTGLIRKLFRKSE